MNKDRIEEINKSALRLHQVIGNTALAEMDAMEKGE